MRPPLLRPVPQHLWTPDTHPDAPVRMRYLGTAGFVVESGDHTLVIDPYVTRPGLRTVATDRLVPHRALIERVIPRADDVLIGHSHFDHILDAPALCERTGARLIGSSDTANVARAAGLAESQIVATEGREDIATRSGHVRGLPSDHGRVYFNRVPLRGRITEPPPWPPRYTDLPHGLVLNWYVEIGGVRIVHIDSAEFFEEELQDVQADVVCLCAIGRQYRPNYVADAVRLLRPKMIVACHWDYFFTQYHAEPLCLPGVDLQGFVNEVRKEGVTPVVLPFDGMLGLGNYAGQETPVPRNPQ